MQLSEGPSQEGGGVRRIVWAWVAGTAMYVASLVGSAVLVGALVTRSGQAVDTWPILVVPAVLAAAVAVLVAGRTPQRPPWWRGLVATVVPAAVAVGTGLAATAAARAHTDVPVASQVTTVVLPAVVLLASGALGGLVARLRWSPSKRTPYTEVV